MHFSRIITILLLYLLLASALPRLEQVKKEVVEQKPLLSEVNNKNILPLDLRSLKDWKLTDLLLVSDIDGNLHAVERNSGAFLWSLPLEEPLVKILKNDFAKKDANNDSNLLWFVEPYEDGSLYYFSPQYGLNKLPASIKNLVMESPFSLKGDNKIYTGVRKTSLYNINLQTGEVVSKFGATCNESYPMPNVHRLPNLDRTNTVVMLGKTTYELSIHHTLDPNVVWNVTYSQWGPNNIDNDLIMQNVQSKDNKYFTPFHDKSLLAIDRTTGTPAWISRLPSLAVNVFDIFNDMDNPDEYVMLPHPLKVLNELQMSTDEYANNDLCFINKTANGREWFAMSFLNYPTLLKSAPLSKYQLALYNFENGILDSKTADYLRELNVNRDDVELVISGVHKINHLNADNAYQPAARFGKAGFKQIGDGSSQEADALSDIDGEQQQIPSLMDGILFPKTNYDLSTIDRDSNDLSYNDKSYKTNLPISYYDGEDLMNRINARDSISMVRRIFEDLVVITTVLLFLFAFGKLGMIVKDLNRDKDEMLEKIDEEAEKSTESVSENDTSLDKVVQEPNGEGDIVSVLEHKPRVKHVTIISPNGNLERAGSEVPELDQEKQSITATENSIDLEDDEVSTTKKKRKRGARGGRRGGRGKKTTVKEDDDRTEQYEGDPADENNAIDDDESSDDGDTIPTKSLVKSIIKPVTQMKKLQIDNNLIISDRILGYGSHGTVVYEGTFENRPVAVKRMLLDFYDIANHEVRLLQESDDHPNVIRYFCSQSSEMEKFLYIALELCVCSLEDIVEKLKSYPKTLWIDHKRHTSVLFQLASGLHYLHSLKIVHRDLKPQNILVGDSTKKNSRVKTSDVRLLISDFGLCKKLDGDQSSFRATTQHAASGTSGWRAPELLLHHDLIEISPDTISSINSASHHSVKDSSQAGNGKRLTKAIDIFSLGCVFYYILTAGNHPFGDRYLREGNIIKGMYDLSALKHFSSGDCVEATDLISSMISFTPRLRPDTAMILKHPYFWPMNKKLEFLLKVSDRFEIERRDPPSDMLLRLEEIGPSVHNGDWLAKFDDLFKDNLGKYRKYSTDKVMDLLRALRNKYHHYNDMPPVLQLQMSPLPHGFYKYFNDKFPNLLMEIYFVVRDNLQDEHVFEEFY